MQETPAKRFWWRTGQFLAGSMGVALLTFVAFRLRATPPTAAVLYFFFIVLFSLWAGFLASALICVPVILVFDYFFCEPLFSLALNQPIDAVALIAFSGSAFIASRVMA